MITIIRSDGVGMVLDGARSLMDVSQGMLVDFGDEIFVVEDCTLSDIVKMTEGRWNSMFVIRKEWRGWPNEAN